MVVLLGLPLESTGAATAAYGTEMGRALPKDGPIVVNTGAADVLVGGGIVTIDEPDRDPA